MRDDEIQARLREVNPWWRAAAAGLDPASWAADDRVLRDRARYDLGYRADILRDVAASPPDDTLIVLRGPRRVGKSVVLKDAVLAICRRPDIDPRQIVYLPADGMRAKDLGRAIALGRALTRSVDQPVTRLRVWLLDEVTSIDGWTTTVKYLRDNSIFGEETVVCTGSSWSETGDVERDLLAGRAGSSSVRRSRLLLPMGFRDFLGVTAHQVPVPAPVPPWNLQGPETAAAAVSLEPFTDELDLAWQAYLTSGGFPRAVSEHHKTGAVSESFMRDIASWLHIDVDREAPVDSVPLLMAELHARSTSPLNRAKTAEALGYHTRNAFDLRLNRLVRSYGALWAHQINDAGHRVAGAQSKLYLADPLLAWIGTALRAGAPEPDMTALAEEAIAVAMAAAIDNRQPGRWTAGDTIGYARTTSGQEIDFAPVAIPGPNGSEWTTPTEVKWVSDGWRAEARTIEGRYHRGIVATKSITRLDTPTWAIPAPLLALLLAQPSLDVAVS
jgi:predicted AAA+ superfamily ATPase